MDKYQKFINVGKFSLISRLPLPRSNKPKFSSLYLSFDNYIDFLKYLDEQDGHMPLLEADFYDEDIILTDDQFSLRYNFLKIINRLNFLKINFHLSDSTMPVYNTIMKNIGWKHKDKTNITMTIDRNHMSNNPEYLRLDCAQGTLLIPEEKLLWCSPELLSKLDGKVEEKTLKATIELKKIVFQYYERLCILYYINRFSEFDKVWLAYDFIKRHIKFASEATMMDNGVQRLYNPYGINSWASEPLGTYIHKRGVCEGQARLFQALLNNPYMKSDTVTISGSCPLGRHVWAGTVINDKLYQTCLTMSRLFKNLNQSGYVPDSTEFYPQIYPSASLNDADINLIREHIKRLNKRGL